MGSGVGDAGIGVIVSVAGFVGAVGGTAVGVSVSGICVGVGASNVGVAGIGEASG